MKKYDERAMLCMCVFAIVSIVSYKMTKTLKQT